MKVLDAYNSVREFLDVYVNPEFYEDVKEHYEAAIIGLDCLDEFFQNGGTETHCEHYGDAMNDETVVKRLDKLEDQVSGLIQAVGLLYVAVEMLGDAVKLPTAGNLTATLDALLRGGSGAPPTPPEPAKTQN